MTNAVSQREPPGAPDGRKQKKRRINENGEYTNEYTNEYGICEDALDESIKTVKYKFPTPYTPTKKRPTKKRPTEEEEEEVQRFSIYCSQRQNSSIPKLLEGLFCVNS